MINLVKTLCALNGMSGWEDEVRDYITDAAKVHTPDVTADTLGNVIVFKKGRARSPQKIAFMAHMDEVGLLVRSVGDDGFLKIAFSGIDPRILPGQRVFVGKSNIPGVIGLKAVHQTDAEERGRAVKADALYIDIGAADKAAAEKLTGPADPVYFPPDIADIGCAVRAKALDDRIGCAVLLKLLAEDLPQDAYFIFTAQEETGLKGAAAAAYAVQPDIAVILEGTTAADRPDLPEHKRVCKMGGGVVLPFMDGGTIYDRKLWEQAKALCEKHSIPWQTKEFVSGGTDAAAVQRSRAGVRVVCAAAAVRHIHTPASMASREDIQHLYALSLAIASGGF